MFYRLAGIRHTSYLQARQLFPMQFDRALIGAILVLALLAPWILPALYLNTYLMPWLLWVTAALGLNLLMGGAGQVHLGYGAVMGIGAYAAGHAARNGIPLEVALMLGGLAAAIIGTIFGAAALRVKGLYLAVTTLALQYLVDFIVLHVSVISGGSQASLQLPVVKILGQSVRSDAGLYFVALASCAVVTIFMLNVRRSSLGRALAAIREKDYAAEILGVSAFRYKLLAFWVASFIGGVTGALLAFCYYKAVSPEQYHIDLSIQMLAIVIVGGLGSVLGCFLGAALILLSPALLNQMLATLSTGFGLKLGTDLTTHAPLILYGALIVGFLLFEPLGLAKIYDNVRKMFLVWPFRHMRR
ncbi:branched-chain amino acid ABC transporter permease [Limnohabitans sp. 2KL-51]|uniref:branched-chain amino acid ABC transporter permease n=1 Tax=Limnohabitans sp. 2KL-51 TaxID=1977911 RepID=UPI000D37D0D5|nr:branched-chain amino acid ABC transporter permease [Limnohabitans sp. 2KL-51]PUE44410.1 branched-chain amino acid ABC transporter permease [Limnohabitans sp. 2KL-51]